MTHQEAARLGGQSTFNKHGSDYMSRIGKKGFWAMIGAVADRDIQSGEVNNPGYSLRNVLKHLIAKKGVR